MQLLVGNPASSSGGCAFLPAAAALRPPSATLSWRRPGCSRRSKRYLSLPRASTDGSGSGAAAAEASTVGDTLEREEGGGGAEAGASAESSNRKQPPPVDPKIEKELKKVSLLPLSPWFIGL